MARAIIKCTEELAPDLEVRIRACCVRTIEGRSVSFVDSRRSFEKPEREIMVESDGIPEVAGGQPYPWAYVDSTEGKLTLVLV